MLHVLLVLLSPAFATEECENLCNAIDAAEETCEAKYGDGDALCDAIGKLDETCDPEDGGTTEECPDLCSKEDALDDECDATKGEADEVCQALNAIAEDCDDGHFDAIVPPGDEDDDDEDGEDDDRRSGAATGDGAGPALCSADPMSATLGSLAIGAAALLGRKRS